MSRILVTGATGFIGSRLVPILLSQGYEVFCFVRNTSKAKSVLSDIRINWFDYDIANPSILPEWFDRIDVIVHLAGLAHGLGKQQHQWENIARTNIDGAVSLAKVAIASEVKQLIYISTVKVHGEYITANETDAFTENSPLLPTEQYAKSKAEAEMALQDVTQNSAMALTVIRPPLVYGPGVKANFYNLIKLVDRSLPLPFAGLNNKRSMIYVDNLISLIIQSIKNPKTLNRAFVVKDVNLSTSELSDAIANALGKQYRFFKLPDKLLSLIFAAVGLSNKWRKLNTSLLVNDSETRECLNWTPPIDFEKGISETVNWYLEQK